MAQTKHRKKQHKQMVHPKPLSESKTGKRKARNAAIVMMVFFGVAGLAVGYLLSDSYIGYIFATLGGILIGFILNKVFSATTEKG